MTALPILIAVFCQVDGSTAITPVAKAYGNTDLVCGPRCLRFILEHYGRKMELLDLVRRTQWPTIENGASLADLDETLRSNGIHTFALRMPEGMDLDWPYPVLLHVQGKGHPVGHFSVWLPRQTGSPALIWDGLNGYQYWEPWALSGSVTVLLTSPLSIDDAMGTAAIRPAPSTLQGVLLLAITCGISGGLYSVKLRRVFTAYSFMSP
jgi:ABC-type bacteriocin/lantibiotic exporter with double-glycine peptidase domain